MNPENLERFIKLNRQNFDSEAPSEKVWEKIQAGLDKKDRKKRFIGYSWLSAASVIIIAGLVWLSVKKLDQQDINLADVNTSYARKDLQFANLIEEKRDSLVFFAKENPELYNSFTHDLLKLDEEYEKLRLELPGSPNPQSLIIAMLNNRQAQLQLLQQQLLILNQVNKSTQL